MGKLFYEYTEFCERCSAKNLEPEAVLTTRILYIYIFFFYEILEFTTVVYTCDICI